MKTIIALIYLLLFVPAAAHALPAIEFTHTSHDFGVIVQDEKARHIFEFENRGDQELIIERLSSS